MAVTGHKTREVFDRYNITTERDVAQAAAQLAQYLGGQSDLYTDKTRTSEPITLSGPLAHQAEHLPFKPALGINPLYLQPLRPKPTDPKKPKPGQNMNSE